MAFVTYTSGSLDEFSKLDCFSAPIAGEASKKKTAIVGQAVAFLWVIEYLCTENARQDPAGENMFGP